ncbi:MAG: P1 family peptidase [Cyclobacteriaceae bacterium]|jgi:hypothetical protein|tara:strand:- start:2574 stop:2861 length:288 start_codon:yes stop_codon:yes gene_type:complete
MFGFQKRHRNCIRKISLPGDNYTLGVLVQSNFGSKKTLPIAGVPVGMAMNDILNAEFYGAHNQDEKKEIDPLLSLSPRMLLSFLINSKELCSASH